jgi:hypothetical protein
MMRIHYVRNCSLYGSTGGIEKTGTHNRSENVEVQESPCALIPLTLTVI